MNLKTFNEIFTLFERGEVAFYIDPYFVSHHFPTGQLDGEGDSTSLGGYATARASGSE